MLYNVVIYDIDLFDIDVVMIVVFKQVGCKVVCYFFVGSLENWWFDFLKFKVFDQGNKFDDWEGECWFDICLSNVCEIMMVCFDCVVVKGCDGVELDNVDGYVNDIGFLLQDIDQYVFNVFIVNEVYKCNLVVGLKNDVDQFVVFELLFDFVVNEECNEQKECDGYMVFMLKNKLVLNVEYVGKYWMLSG